MTQSTGLNKLIQTFGYIGFGFLIFNGFFAWFTGSPVIASPYAAVQPDSTVPQYINYQGTLLDGEGVNLDGTYDITFRIYDDALGTNILFAESHTGVIVKHGNFGVNLGEGAPVAGEANGNMAGFGEVFSKPDRFVGVTVAPFEEMVPLQRFVTVAYAFLAQEAVFSARAAVAADAELLDGKDSTAFEPIFPSVIYQPGGSNPALSVTDANDINVERNLTAKIDVIAIDDLHAKDDLFVTDLTRTGRAQVTGNLSFGSLSGFSLTTSSIGNHGANQGDSATKSVRLPRTSTSFCALSRVAMNGMEDDFGFGTCRVRPIGDNWYLQAILSKPNSHMDIDCTAVCLEWD